MTTKAVAVKEDNQFALMAMGKNEIKDLIEQNLAGENIDPNTDLVRIKVPTGGGTTWTIPTIEGDVDTKEITGIIVAHQLIRVYWQEAYGKGGGTPPDCSSMDCITGEGDPGGDCMNCEFSQFKSDPDPKSDAQACSQKRLLFMVLKDEILPCVVSAPPTSLKSTKKFLLGLSSRRKKFTSIFTKLTLVKKDEYAVIVFESGGEVPNPELTAMYAETIRPHLIKSIPKVLDD